MFPMQRTTLSVLLSILLSSHMVAVLDGYMPSECSTDQNISDSNVFKQMWDQHFLSKSAAVLLQHHFRTFMFLIVKRLGMLLGPKL